MENRRRFSLVLALVLLLGILPRGAVPVHAEDSRTFPETGKTAKGRFLTYWDNHGALAQQGYPISEEMQEQSDTDGKTYTVQYFQRAVFEFHPEFVGTPSEVLLSLLGVFYYNDKYGGNAANQKANVDIPRKFAETGKTIGGAFRQYWEAHGGLVQQGYPISDEFQEVDKDGNLRTVQYFQRAVFEFHPEFAGTPSQVLLSLLGVSSYNKKHGGGAPSPAPGQPTATAQPGKAPTATPTTLPAPPPVDNSGQAFLYNSVLGKAVVGHVDASGNYTDLKVALAGGSTGWTHIVALGGGRLLFYNKNNGRDGVGQVATDGTYTDTAGSYALALGPGWTHVASAGNNLIIYYKDTTSTGGTARVNADGTITLLKVYTTFGTGWTHIAGLSNGVYFFYQRSTGTATTLRVNSDGSIVNLKSYYNTLQKIWTNVVAGSNGNILFYYSIDGRAVAGKVDDNGNYTAGQTYPDSKGNPPLPNPFPVIAGLSNGTLLFYNDSQRSAVTARMSGDGSIPIYNKIPAGTFQVWTHIEGIR